MTRSSIRKNAWTLTHGYYAAMGGFVLDSSSTPVFGTESRLVLTPPMMYFLMKHDPDLIPDISEDDIECQSKSDGLAKALLVMQLLYFSVSCIARLTQALPLALFEIWTLSHAFGTIFVYIIWWKKPLNIPNPTVIEGERAHGFAAYFQVIGKPRSTDPYLTGSTERSYLSIAACEPLEDSGIVPEEKQETLTLLPGKSVRIEGYTFTIGTEEPNTSDRRIFGATHCPWHALERGPDGSVSLGKADILRWRLAACTAARIGGVWEPEYPILYMKAMGLSEASPVSTDLETDTKVIVPVALVTAYTLLHFLGWNAAFQTHFDQKIWRTGTIIMANYPTFFCIICAVTPYLPRITPMIPPFLYRLALHAVTPLIISGPLCLCVMANYYFLVMSLIQLFHLPDGAFLLPNFSVYFPHFA